MTYFALETLFTLRSSSLSTYETILEVSLILVVSSSLIYVMNLRPLKMETYKLLSKKNELVYSN